MTEFKKLMDELKEEKNFCISVNWLEKAKKINSEMVELIYKNI